MSDGLRLHTGVFDAAFDRLALTSKRELHVLAEEQMRGVIRHVIGVTPPAYHHQTEGGAWIGASGGAAMRHGQALVKADIRSVYGMPRDAYDAIREKDAKQAKAFWRHHRQGEPESANAIARKVIGKGVYAFDGGKAHQNLKRGRARGRARTPIYFVADDTFLKLYIKAIQERVGWLAAGWKAAALELGVRLPQWIAKHPAPGAVRVESSDHSVRLVATNAVNFASQINDLNRRMQYALDSQAAAMDRRVNDWLVKRFRMPGFVVQP